jgi:hypothetical protein
MDNQNPSPVPDDASDHSHASDDETFHDADSHDGNPQVTSPIVSPPFWRIHKRTTSTISTESVLPGAITLTDNEASDYGRWCPESVEIPDWTIVNGSNFGAFVVFNINIKIGTLTGGSISIHKRYSEFDALRRQLVVAFPNSKAAIPDLPKKSVYANFRPAFLSKRRAGLQYFLHFVVLNPEFSSSPILKDFIFA